MWRRSIAMAGLALAILAGGERRILAQDRSLADSRSTEELIDLLADRHEPGRAKLLDRLEERGTRVIPELVGALESPAAPVRCGVLEVLARIGDASLGPLVAWGKEAGGQHLGVLSELEKDANSTLEARTLAARVLAAGGEAGLDALRKLLVDADEPGRVAAAFAIGTLAAGGRGAIPTLLDALVDASPWVRLNVIQALGLLCRPVRPEGETLRATIQAMRHRDGLTPEEIRWLDAEAARLERVSGPVLPERAKLEGQVGKRLVEVLDAPAEPPDIRRAAAESLALIGEPSVAVLTERLARPELRAVVAEVLATMEPPPIEALLVVLRSSSEPRRVGAAVALAEQGTRAIGALGDLRHALSDPSRDVRIRAAWAIGEMGLEAIDAAADLRDLRKGGDPVERIWADYALMRVDPASAEAIDDLLVAFESADSAESKHARDALALLDQKAVVAMTRELSGADEARRGRLVDLLSVLPVSREGVVPVLVGRLVNDPSAAVRRQAARVLGSFGPEASLALEALRQSQTDPDAGVRNEAARAIEAIVSPRVRH